MAAIDPSHRRQNDFVTKLALSLSLSLSPFSIRPPILSPSPSSSPFLPHARVLARSPRPSLPSLARLPARLPAPPRRRTAAPPPLRRSRALVRPPALSAVRRLVHDLVLFSLKLRAPFGSAAPPTRERLCAQPRAAATVRKFRREGGSNDSESAARGGRALFSRRSQPVRSRLQRFVTRFPRRMEPLYSIIASHRTRTVCLARSTFSRLLELAPCSPRSFTTIALRSNRSRGRLCTL
jgi:hypothetical protein